MSEAVLSVSSLNFYIKSLLDGDIHLQTVFLRGEISNLTNHYRSGHLYLSLKDEKSSVRAVMFSKSAVRLKFQPEDGMDVIVRGRVSVYEATGQYQIYIDDMQPAGAGALNLAFEHLKEKLSKEGLFDETHKKPLPRYPSRIAVITSPTGAAVHDITKIINHRYPIAEIIICPVLVQGDEAPEQLSQALDRVNYLACADLAIIGRGGGSAEDLWAFNDERVVRAVYRSVVPVISAVGHETDFTLCDFAADVRASTPSAAAELAVPLLSDMLCEMEALHSELTSAAKAKLHAERHHLDSLSGERLINKPLENIKSNIKQVEVLAYRLNSEYKNLILCKNNKLMPLISRLESLSPLGIISRGYAVVQSGDRLIQSANQVKTGDDITVLLHDGRLLCEIMEKRGYAYEQSV